MGVGRIKEKGEREWGLAEKRLTEVPPTLTAKLGLAVKKLTESPLVLTANP